MEYKFLWFGKDFREIVQRFRMVLFSFFQRSFFILFFCFFVFFFVFVFIFFFIFFYFFFIFFFCFFLGGGCFCLFDGEKRGKGKENKIKERKQRIKNKEKRKRKEITFGLSFFLAVSDPTSKKRNKEKDLFF